jgi:hypothetical protein
MSDWIVTADADVQTITDGTQALAMDMDPRQPSIALGARHVSGGGPELWHGAILRAFFDGRAADWRPVMAWLRGPAAAPLLAAVMAGYEAQLVWTGDWVGRWTPDAKAAAVAVHARVATLLTQPSSDPASD